ncbi:MAG TPA: pseudouridine synthase [Solirubrobacteraceae bacterium]|jgi:23S rRNA pseudouridine2605 synthase
MRLTKFLSSAGVASRRAAETIIRSGRVTVDGAVIDDPAHPVTAEQVIAVDGVRVQDAGPRAAYAVNKPPGYVSTARDPQRRPTVISLVPSRLRLYPVGRLDIDTTGLILLTNDGALAHQLTHPRFEVPKTYTAVVGGGPVSERALRALAAGVALEDGRTAPARARWLSGDTIQLTIREGRKHQVKRMCKQVGHPVRELQRTAIGSLELGDLPLGSYRLLTDAELAALTASGSTARRGQAASSAERPRPHSASAERGATRSSAES